MKALPVLAAVIVTAGAAHSGTLEIQKYRVSPVTQFVIPAVADSVTGPANKFDVSGFLSARRPLLANLKADWTTMVPGTDSLVTLQKPVEGAAVRALHTRIRPERFMKGKLKLETNARAEVYVDGKSVLKVEQSDSTLSTHHAPLSLKPEQTADIQVNILTVSEDTDDAKVRLTLVPDSDFEDVAIIASPELKDRVRVETVSLGARASGTSISPDGKYILTSFGEMYDSERTRSWRTLRETSTSKLISSDIPSSAQWLPQGSTLLYTRQTDDTYSLYTLDPATLQSKMLATDVPDDNFVISPDCSYIIYHDHVEGKAEEGIMRRVDNPDDRQPGNRDRYYLVRYDLKEGVARPLTYGGASTVLEDISSDSKKILYSSQRFTPEEYPFYLTDLIELDVKTLKADTLARNVTALTGAVYSPDAKHLFLTGGPSCFDDLGKNCGDHPIANDFDIQGYLMDVKSRKVTPLTLDFDPSIKGTPVWNYSDNRIYFLGEAGFYQNVYRLNPSDGKIDKLPVSLEYTRNFSVGTHENCWLTATGQSYTYAGRSVLLDLKSGKCVTLDDPVAELTGNVQFGQSEHWKFVSRDGTEIDGMITLPPDFDPSRKYPLIVYYYGGTAPSSVGMNHPYTPEMFASRDYVVYTINPSGTTGYGQEFSARHVNAWGDYTADDIIEGVNKFCDAHDFVDRKKIGCLGASYGGFMTQLLQTKTDIFAAAVSHAGISDVTSYWGEGFWGYSYNAVAAAKSYPWTNPDLFTKHGSLFNADKIHTPLLLLHGTVDTNVPIGESIQLFNALRILGRDVEFITVEGANHVVTEYDKRKVWQATIMAWFAKYLQDDPRWWNEMY